MEQNETGQQFSDRQQSAKELISILVQIKKKKSVEDLLSVLADERAKLRRQQRATQWAVGGIMGGIVFLVLLMAMIQKHFDWSNLTIYLGCFGSLGAAAAASSRHKQAVKELAEFDDTRSVGPLVEALQLGDRDIRAVASDALKRLLPRLRASDGHLLAMEHHRTLARVLHLTRNGVDVPLACAILKALQQVGNESDLAPVTTWAMLDETKERSAIAPVIQAARECLPALQENIRRAQAEQTLLRASSPAPSSEFHLLRPAESVISVLPHEELLQPRQCEALPGASHEETDHGEISGKEQRAVQAARETSCPPLATRSDDTSEQAALGLIQNS